MYLFTELSSKHQIRQIVRLFNILGYYNSIGVSLSIFKIKDYKKENFVWNDKISTLTGQLNFKDLELMDELGSAKSTLKLRGFDKEKSLASYDTVHFSDTIKNPVRVFLRNY